MGVSKTLDLTQQYKQNVYSIALDVSGWDTVNLQVLSPMVGTIYVYGTLNDGMSQGSLYATDNYGADRARDWTAVEAVALATGTAATSITAAGIYSVPVNYPYLKVGGGGANVYGLFQNNIKIG